MSETQAKEQCSANLTTLRHQLEEMAARTKAVKPAVDRPNVVQGPVLVIRGK